MAILFLGFAVAMAVGTFIESKYNTDTARILVYNSWWFEGIMLFFVINFIGNIKRYQLYKKEKWATLFLHLSWIFIISGAFITRYISYEGMMPIREGAASNQFFSDKNYLTYSVYSTNKEIGANLNDLPYDNEFIFHMIKSQLEPMNNINYVREGEACWYNHSKYRPAAYHFLSAITKKNMLSLNGFDERYSNGIGFDDDEFLHRIKLMGLEIKIIDEPFAVHQWHYSENNFFANHEDISSAIQKNKSLFDNMTKKSSSWYVN